MKICLLCLESRSDADYQKYIVVHSPQWSELNIFEIIDKHFWPIDYVQFVHGICSSCWSKLYDFHRFHKTIEKAHAIYMRVDREQSAPNIELQRSTSDDNIEMEIKPFAIPQILKTESVSTDEYISVDDENIRNMGTEENFETNGGICANPSVMETNKNEAISIPQKKRGRPPKLLDNNKVIIIKRKPGRPFKTEMNFLLRNSMKTDLKSDPLANVKIKTRGRGRPPKNEMKIIKRGPGRPPKNEMKIIKEGHSRPPTNQMKIIKRTRGRPPKIKVNETNVAIKKPHAIYMRLYREQSLSNIGLQRSTNDGNIEMKINNFVRSNTESMSTDEFISVGGEHIRNIRTKENLETNGGISRPQRKRLCPLKLLDINAEIIKRYKRKPGRPRIKENKLLLRKTMKTDLKSNPLANVKIKKSGRGRPPKNEMKIIKRGRGRPPRNQMTIIKKSRGRPPKKKVSETENIASLTDKSNNTLEISNPQNLKVQGNDIEELSINSNNEILTKSKKLVKPYNYLSILKKRRRIQQHKTLMRSYIATSVRCMKFLGK